MKVPPGVANSTFTTPDICGGVTTETVVGLITVTEFASTPPNITDEVLVRFVPVSVSDLPPATGPAKSDTLSMVGNSTKVYAPANVADPPAGVVNTTSTTPALLAGVVTVTDEALSTVTDLLAVPPNVTADAPVRFVPVIVTIALPATGPDDRDRRVIVGASTNVYAPTETTDPPGVVNTTSATPAGFAGVTTVTEVALKLVIEVPGVPPIVNSEISVKFVPLIVTSVPPMTGPDDNPAEVKTETTVGAATNVYASTAVTDPPGVVNTTSTTPADLAGETTETVVGLTTVMEVPGVPPKVTADAPVSSDPVTVTVVPPAIGPDTGHTPRSLLIGRLFDFLSSVAVIGSDYNFVLFDR